MLRFLLLLLAFVFCADSLQAQVQVGIKTRRRMHVMYEPTIVTVLIRNLSGRDLPLVDEDGQQWFGFEITKDDGRVIPPFNTEYTLEPLIIPAGQTVERTVNLNELYGLSEFGLYRIRGTIYFSPLKQFYQSGIVNVEISDGKPIWQQTVGVPEGEPGAGSTRRYSVLSFRQVNASYLYIRVEDVENNTILATFPVGRLVSGMEPAVRLDLGNVLNVLQVTGPKTYLHTQVGLDGKLRSQDTYIATDKTRPGLKLTKSGVVTVVGGQLQVGNAATGTQNAAAAPGIPKLSDQPIKLPKN